MNYVNIEYLSIHSHIRRWFLLKMIMVVILLNSFLSNLNSSPKNHDGDYSHEKVYFTAQMADVGNMMPTFYESVEYEFKSGSARVNITPSVPVIMSGYSGRPCPFKGVNDSLFAVATVFDDGIKKAAIIAADLIGFSHDSWDELTKLIEKETGILQKYILLSPNHTHGGPATGRYGGETDSNLVEYYGELRDKIVSVTKEALENLQPALIGSGKGICRLSINRRALNSRTGGLRIGKNPDGPVDHEVGVVRIDNLHGIPFAIFVNWPTHGTVMGRENYMITGDWPGAARRYIERELSPVIASVTAGASGDVNPLYIELPTFDAGEMEETGIILGKEVVKVSNEISSFRASSINALQRVITLPGKTSGGSWLPQESFDPGPDVIVRLSLVKVGSVVFAGISGEVFSEIGIKIKELSPYKNTHIITHCNGASGYLITDSAYPEGGYEVSATRVMSGAEKAIIDNIVEMLNEI